MVIFDENQGGKGPKWLFRSRLPILGQAPRLLYQNGRFDNNNREKQMRNLLAKNMTPSGSAAAIDSWSNASVSQAPFGDDLNLRGIGLVLRSHWPSVLTVMGLVLLSGILLSLLKQPEFVSTGVISVEAPPGVATKGKAPRADPNSAGKDVALLRSRRLALRVIQGLDSEPESSTSEQGDAVAVSPRRVSRFLKNLEVSRAPGSSVIDISYRSDSPRYATRVVNLVIDTFRQLKGEQTGALFASEKQHVASELERRRNELLAAEKRLSDFKKANGLADNVGVTMKARQVGTLNGQLVLAKAEAEKAESRWRQIDALIRAGNMAAVGAAVDSPLVRRFREKEVELSNRISEMRNEYGPLHPAMIDMKSQVADLRTSINRELRYLSRSMKDKVAVEQQKVNSLQQGIDGLEKEIALAESAGSGLRELELEAESLRELFRSLLKRSKQLGAQARDLEVEKSISVISPAYAPAGPVFPTKRHILYLTVTGALLLGLLTAFLAESLNPVVTGRQTGRTLMDASAVPDSAGSLVEDASGSKAKRSRRSRLNLIPVGGESRRRTPVAIPIPGDGNNIVPASEVLMKQKSRFAAAIGELNGNLMKRLKNGGPKVVLITGANNVGDKVSVASALAALNAYKGRRVVLVDLSRGESDVHHAFGREPAPGIAEILNKSSTLTKALQTDFRTHVTLLARGDFIDDRLAMKVIDVVPSLLVLLKKYFDLVFVVTRNVGVATEAEIFSDQVEQVIVVVGPEEGDFSMRSDRIFSDPRLQRLQSRLLPVFVQR